MIKKQLIDEYDIKFDTDVSISEDIGFYMKVLTVSPAKCVDEHLSYYNMRDDSVMHKGFETIKWQGGVDQPDASSTAPLIFIPEATFFRLFDRFLSFLFNSFIAHIAAVLFLRTMDIGLSSLTYYHLFLTLKTPSLASITILSCIPLHYYKALRLS